MKITPNTTTLTPAERHRRFPRPHPSKGQVWLGRLHGELLRHTVLEVWEEDSQVAISVKTDLAGWEPLDEFKQRCCTRIGWRPILFGIPLWFTPDPEAGKYTTPTPTQNSHNHNKIT